MKSTRLFALILATAAGIGLCAAQSSMPAPGRPSGSMSNSMPAPGQPSGTMNGGPGFGGPGFGGPGPGPAAGGPWWGSGPAWSVSYTPSWANSGYTTVTACGYDSSGRWEVIPLYVQYQYNGVQYNVTVINAYNPFTNMWDQGVDQGAFNTSYYINGNTYDFYAPLSTGVYYFNL